jgi:hypothetical protein
MLNRPHPGGRPSPVLPTSAGSNDSLIRHGNAQHAVLIDRQIHADPIGMRVLDRVQEQLAHRLEQQRADVLSRGIGQRRGRHLDLDPVLVPRPVRQPGERAGQSRALQDRRKQLEAQGSGSRNRFVEVTLRFHEVFGWRASRLRVMLHLLVQVQCRDEQQLLETVVKCFGELFARVLLGERQV